MRELEHRTLTQLKGHRLYYRTRFEELRKENKLSVGKVREIRKQIRVLTDAICKFKRSTRILDQLIKADQNNIIQVEIFPP